MTPLDLPESTIVGSATTMWNITYDHHCDSSRGVIYDHNILTIQAKGGGSIHSPWGCTF
jgi:hypothetical protein